jgi:glutamine amidotransferase-like uncharacterized protein
MAVHSPRAIGAIILALSCLSAMAQGPDTSQPIRVAIFDDAGGSEKGPPNVERCLPAAGGFKTERVTAADIRGGALDRFDVVIHPGGSGSKQAAALEESGRHAVRQFVEQGGGFVGICAGAYLASAHYPWSLGLIDARVVDREHWARGTGDVQIVLTSAAREVFAADQEEVTIYYGQGPLLAPAGSEDIPDYQMLASYETEIAENGAPHGVMQGTTAIARGTFGKGRVFCFSPHPEKTPKLDPFVRAAVLWVAHSAAAARTDKQAVARRAEP